MSDLPKKIRLREFRQRRRSLKGDLLALFGRLAWAAWVVALFLVVTNGLIEAYIKRRPSLGLTNQ